MSKIPGVGYNPGPGLVFWIWPGSRESAGTTAFNPAAGDPFGTGEAGTLNLAVFNARYGGRPVRADGTIGNFVVDAETVLGSLTRAMELAASKGIESAFTGRPETHTMVPTIREAHDYAATHSDGGLGLMGSVGIGATGEGGNPPGQPRITRLSSPGPGTVTISLITSAAETFEIDLAGHFVVVQDQPGNPTRTYTITLPPGFGGNLSVKARSFRGGVPGKWSIPRKVAVAPLTTGPTDVLLVRDLPPDMLDTLETTRRRCAYMAAKAGADSVSRGELEELSNSLQSALVFAHRALRML